MDALIPAFIAVLLAETGDRVQSQAHRLGLTFSDHRPIYAALIIVTAINVSIGGIGGSYIASLISFEARTLFAGLALLLGGLPMLLKVAPVKPITQASPFLASAIRFIPAQIAGASPFIVAGLAARSDTTGFAIAGGFAGVLAASIPPLLLKEEWPGVLPLTALRRIAAALLIGAGLWLVVNALRLI
jgi:putative Ca2+/H+ antiporter (TMEM165/GDT1 family)